MHLQDSAEQPSDFAWFSFSESSKLIIMHYRPEVDGLRAIAVLPVILFHAGFSWFSGGYVGVDVFFVISGFLITSILISDLNHGTFSIARFYERRARRILPALFFVMLCCIPLAWAWMAPSQFKAFAQGLVAISLFSSNVLFWRNENYFAPDAEENPLLHTWSLAVEEQFYLFFPLLLAILWRFGKSPIFYVLLGLSLLSLLLSQWASKHYPSANFYLLPTRAWELGVGALCALHMSVKAYKPSQTWSLLGFGLIIVSIFVFTEATPFPSIYTLVPVIGTALVILFGMPATFVGKFLSKQVFVSLGLISFSAYLWHQPLFAFARVRSLNEPSDILMLGLSFLTLGLAWLSWKYVEQPFRKGGLSILPTRKGVFTASAFASVLFVSFGLFGDSSQGFPSRVSLPELVSNDLNVRKHQEECFDFSLEKMQTQGYFCQLGHEQQGPAIAVIGDSHSLSFLPSLSEQASAHGHALLYSGVSSCPPTINTFVLKQDHKSREVCAERNRQAHKRAAERGIKKVILIARWTRYSTGDISTPALKIDDKFDVDERANPTAKLMDRLGATLRFYSQHGIEVIVFHQPPVQEVDARSLYNYLAVNAVDDSQRHINDQSIKRAVHTQNYHPVRELLNSQAARFKNAKTLDVVPQLCPKDTCTMGTLDRSFYLDDDHLSNFGAAMIVDSNTDMIFGK